MNEQQKGSKERQLKADKSRKYYALMKRWKELFSPGKEFSEERLRFAKWEMTSW